MSVPDLHPQLPGETPKSRAQQCRETRDRIYECALAEFRRVGFAKGQIDRIVEAAGVARGTFYFHFPTKDHVLLEIRRRRVPSVIKRVRGGGEPESIQACQRGVRNPSRPEIEA